ncbi:hypothetical protein VE01_10674 [Pseudogymnoascus verrucosus]|uniref:Uncharacterized protein n=1 Tax=Pseudogymnoascus verrucosus TaxID=342668 RepID=A0A1B8G685_9PEZI|nr:uncharacterized protein VE01_10674 [Pseudogymnoascus verrucosus]OBT91345.1 hypothetical protein VE01_10674 [Pseudogymnoascus verrucosus]
MEPFRVHLERVTRVTYPGNQDGFGRGIEMALVKRERKRHIIDQVDRLRELQEIDGEYGDEEAKADCTAVWDEMSRLTTEAFALEHEADDAANENSANAKRLGVSVEILKEAQQKTNRELLEARVDSRVAKSDSEWAKAKLDAAEGVIKQLRDERGKEKAEMDATRKEKERLQIELDAMRKEREKGEADLDAMRKERDKEKAEMDALRDERESLNAMRKEKERLEADLDAMRKEFQDEKNKYTVDLDALKQSDAAALNAARDATSRDAATISTLRKKIAEDGLRMATERLQAHTSAQDSATRIAVVEAEAKTAVDGLRTANAGLVGENRRLLLQVGRFMQEKTASGLRVTDLADQVATLNQEKVVIMAAQENLVRDNTRKGALVEHLQGDILSGYNAIKEKTLAIAKLEADVSNAAKTQDVLAKITTAIEAANSGYIVRLEHENTALRQNSVVAGKVEEANQSLRGQITQMTVRAEKAEALYDAQKNEHSVKIASLEKSHAIAESLGKLNSIANTSTSRLSTIENAVTMQSEQIKRGMADTQRRLSKIGIAADLNGNRIGDTVFELDLLSKSVAEMAGVAMKSDGFSAILSAFGDRVDLTKDMLETTIEKAQRAIIEEASTARLEAHSNRARIISEIDSSMRAVQSKVDDTVTNSRNGIRELLWDLRRDSVMSSIFEMSIKRISDCLAQMDEKVQRLQKSVDGSEDSRMETILTVIGDSATKGEVTKAVANEFKRAAADERERVRKAQQEEEEEAERRRKARVSAIFSFLVHFIVVIHEHEPSSAPGIIYDDESAARWAISLLADCELPLAAHRRVSITERNRSVVDMPPAVSFVIPAMSFGDTPMATSSAEISDTTGTGGPINSRHAAGSKHRELDADIPMTKARLPTPVHTSVIEPNATEASATETSPVVPSVSGNSPLYIATNVSGHSPVMPPANPVGPIASTSATPAGPVPVATSAGPSAVPVPSRIEAPPGVAVGSLDFRFLVSSTLGNGVFTSHVHEETLGTITAAIIPLRDRKKWWRPNPLAVRCVFHRVNRRRNRPDNAHEAGNWCCGGCIEEGTPCIMYGADGIPTILPLAPRLRSVNALPATAGFFLLEPIVIG